jgi:hypothetical protein
MEIISESCLGSKFAFSEADRFKIIRTLTNRTGGQAFTIIKASGRISDIGSVSSRLSIKPLALGILTDLSR